jgi:hypothetical protein
VSRAVPTKSTVALCVATCLFGAVVSACDSGINFTIKSKDLPGSSFHTSTPGASVPTTDGTPTTVATAGVAPCTAGNLVAKGGSSNNPNDPGGAIGNVLIADYTNTACELKGIPTIELLKANGELLDVTQGAPISSALPAVVIQPGQATSAELVFTWTNWCPAAPGALTIQIDLANTGGVLDAPLNGERGDYVPTCSRPGAPSVVRVQYAYINAGTAKVSSA